MRLMGNPGEVLGVVGLPREYDASSVGARSAGLVLVLAAQTPPEAHLGHRVGADFQLPGWKSISSWYKELDAASARVNWPSAAPSGILPCMSKAAILGAVLGGLLLATGGVGKACVWAKENSREAILDALLRRGMLSDDDLPDFRGDKKRPCHADQVVRAGELLREPPRFRRIRRRPDRTPASGADGTTLSTWQEKAAKDFMIEHWAEEFSLAAVAAAANLSDSAFALGFASVTGQKPEQWLMRYRIGRAKRYLVEAGLPLAEIAARCGFADETRFVEAFHAVTGVSPSAWRARWLQ